MSRKKDQYLNPVQRFMIFIQGDRFKFAFFITLMFISVLALVGFVSYLSYWREDQNKFELGIWRYIFDTEVDVENWGHKWGALMAHLCIHSLFGVPSFALIFLLVLTGFRCVNYQPLPYKATLKHTLIWMVWLSLFLGFVTKSCDFYYGGVVGYQVSWWLYTLMGSLCTTLFLILLAGAILVFTFDNSVPWIKIFFDDFKKHHSLRTAWDSANTFTRNLAEAGQQKAADKPKSSARRRDYDDNYEVDFDDDSGDVSNSQSASLNSPVNTSDASAADKSKGIGSFFKDMFTGKDYVGKDQKIEFDERPQNPAPQRPKQQGPETTTEKFVIGGPSADSQTSASPSSDDDDILEFEVEDTTLHDDRAPQPQGGIEAPDPFQQPVNIMPGMDTSTPQPLSEGESMPMQVEINHDVRADDISNLPPYDPTAELSNYRLPPISLLRVNNDKSSVSNDELTENKAKIVNVLKDFKIKVVKISAKIGPTVTLYEIKPAPGVKISKIQSLQNDIMMNLKAKGLRIIAPIPGQGTVGIEVPNKVPAIVSMESLVSTVKFQESDYELPVILGKTINNEAFMIDLVKCPHMLVAGATGQGKSVGLNAIIASILYKKHPSQVKFVFVDPKKVELTLYKKIEKHFLAKLPNSDEAIITDVDQVKNTLNSLAVEMDNRYGLLQEAECRNLKEYNAKFIARRLNPERGHKFMPYIVLVIDEFADLIMTAGKEVEKPLARLAQLARAIGIHLIVATQRPDVKIITGSIKANFPVRVAFRTMSQIDSRTILDQAGAENLIGRGDMLINTGSEITRLQCAFIDTPELEDITKYIASQQSPVCTYELPEPDIEAGEPGEEVDLSRRDSLFEEAARIIVATQSGSTSMLQRKLEIGYNRAGRIMDQLEAAGIVGPNEGSKARAVNIDNEYALEQFINNLDRNV